MGLKATTEIWESEVRGLYGIDKRTDRSLLQPQFFSDCNNLVLEQGIAKTRPGSIAWGTLSFAGIAGTIHGKLHTVEVGTDTYCLLHVGTKLYFGKKTDGAPTTVKDLTGADTAVYDQDSSFEDWGYYFGATGQAVIRVLFKQKATPANPGAQCLALEFMSSTGQWKSMSAGISNTNLLVTPQGISNPYSAQTLGTYRFRVTPIRVIDGVRVAAGPPTGALQSEYLGAGMQVPRPYATYEITSVSTALEIRVDLVAALDAQVTHLLVEITKNLDFSDSPSVSSNGNDPTLFYEDVTAVYMGATQTIDINNANVDRFSTIAPNIWGYQPIPGHLVSTFTAGILWFGGFGTFPSRMYHSATTGYPWHYGLYDPTAFHAVEESDNKIITAIRIISDHLAIWKENKTAILPNRDPSASIQWRDRKVGVIFRTCAESITEDEVICLCHDGMVRVFNGVAYSSKKDLQGVETDLSDKIRALTDAIDPNTVNFVWHKERLALLYGASGSRKALVLHPRENFSWMPWSGLEHEWNALVSNDNQWIYLSTITRTFFEQSPASTETYLDRALNPVAWTATPVAVQGKVRKNKIFMDQLLIEGGFQYLMSAVLSMDGGRDVTAIVNGTPDPELPENAYQNWYKIAPDESVSGNFYTLTLTGQGKAILRAFFHRVIEHSLIGAGWTPGRGANYRAYFFLPSWVSVVLLHLRFDVDSDTEQDYSAQNRDHAYTPAGGSRTFDATLAPNGGQSLVRGAGSGYYDASWSGMDYIGDEAGYNSRALAYEFCVSFPTLATDQIIVEDGDGTNYIRMLVRADGALQFQIRTSALSYAFTTAPGIIIAGATEYVIQFSLSNGGLNGQFYVGSITGNCSTVLTNRAVL